MSKSGSPWQDARRAWEHLAGWHRTPSKPPADNPDTPDSPDSPDSPGEAALEALTDIGTVRRLLDQVELDAVRAARRERRSWAEIAIRLGVSRQSAWERWHELDDEIAGPRPPAGTSGEAGAKGPGGNASGAAGGQSGDAPDENATQSRRRSLRFGTESLLGRAASEMLQDATDQLSDARRRPRRHSRLVPSVIGLSWDDARAKLSGVSLIGVGPDPDGPPVPADALDSGSVVVSQVPAAGTRVAIGTMVRLSLGPAGGSAGVREPRRPVPSPIPAREMHPEPADEAIG
ncbi:PASTA domain-containing protein [Parafrankia sp. EUN1f]|uniref:PASTA domain-containing protein n=1 Tax=Parafrankia sp. EUN1f TaxID=102897 RepID=UPI0001C46475|nr:PASTA domain-containing protein [Parafrankia sp. EUN1f]EFC80799.1 PASTA domain containing protein [Parafrankia sp. EUN1f]